MLLHTDLIDPTTLTGYVRADLADLEINRFSLAQFLPNDEIDDLQYRFNTGGEGLAEAATFRAYDAESPIGSRPGVSRVTGELPPISRKTRLGEYDRLRQRRNSDEAVERAVLGDARRLVRGIRARMELARGDALVNGSVTIAENHVTASIDFGRQGNHTTTPSIVWSTVATATVIQDLITWKDRYIETNDGEAPGAIVMSSTVMGYVQRNAEVRTLGASLAGTPAIVGVDTVNAVLASFALPPIYPYDVRVKINGTTTRVIAADKVLLLPAPVGADSPDSTDLGATLWGTTAESLEENYGLDGEEAGIVAGVYSTEDPVGLWTKAAAIGVPILANPNLSLCADVA